MNMVEEKDMVMAAVAKDSLCEDARHEDGMPRKPRHQEGKPRNGRLGKIVSPQLLAVPLKIEEYLDLLTDKKRSKREEAMKKIVEALAYNLEHDFLQKNYLALLYNFHSIITKGCAKDIKLASQGIGLIAMILKDKDCANEVYQESLTVLSEALNNESKALEILDCLAIVTFFGASNPVEIETGMLIIWEFIVNQYSSKHSASILAKGISAWSFLLAKIEGWTISYKHWKNAMSYLLRQLEEDEDELIFKAASEALASIFEIGCLEKFSSEFSRKTDEDELKHNIIEQLRCHAMKETEVNASFDVLKFFEEGELVESFESVGKDKVMLSSSCQITQLNFVRQFLGEDVFVKHMKDNENLGQIFVFAPREQDNKGCTVERTEIKFRFFQPKYLTKKKVDPYKSLDAEKGAKQEHEVPKYQYLNKARSQLMAKQRRVRE